MATKFQSSRAAAPLRSLWQPTTDGRTDGQTDGLEERREKRSEMRKERETRAENPEASGTGVCRSGNSDRASFVRWPQSGGHLGTRLNLGNRRTRTHS